MCQCCRWSTAGDCVGKSAVVCWHLVLHPPNKMGRWCTPYYPNAWACHRPVPKLVLMRRYKRWNMHRTFHLATSYLPNSLYKNSETSLGKWAGWDGAHLPGSRQKGTGGRGSQCFIDIHEAAKRRGWTHTWLRSNQPQASVLTPSCVPPPPHSSYPTLLLPQRPSSFRDPLHSVVVRPR